MSTPPRRATRCLCDVDAPAAARQLDDAHAAALPAKERCACCAADAAPRGKAARLRYAVDCRADTRPVLLPAAAERTHDAAAHAFAAVLSPQR